MTNRRNFMLQTAAAAGVLALQSTEMRAERSTQSSVSKPLRVLILGGTGYIGPHFVRAAVDRGHKVSVFNRGRSDTELPAEVERLIGDRNADLKSIKNRDWDAVFDLAALAPIWVRTFGEALKDRVNHYTFISTVAVYEHPRGDELISENSQRLTYHGNEDPYTLTGPRDVHEYGALKALCEEEAERQVPGRTLILRPGYIVGPGDPQDYFTYWPVRMAKGGEVLVSGDTSTSIQFIDVRDLAQWSLSMAEKQVTGIYNTVGPAVHTGFGELINAARGAASKLPTVTWVPPAWLVAQKSKDMWGRLLFWSFEPEGWAWSMRMNIGRALANGLTLRPMGTTLSETFDWYQKLPEERQAKLLTRKKQKVGGGELDIETVPWQVYLRCEKEVLHAWRVQRAK